MLGPVIFGRDAILHALRIHQALAPFGLKPQIVRCLRTTGGNRDLVQRELGRTVGE
jgi:hypothetical protein